MKNFFIVIILFAMSAAPAHAADVIIKNAQIVTMDAERRVIEDGVVIIDGPDIIAVGGAALLDKHDAPTIIDADGDIVMPGMDGIELSQKATHHCDKLKVMFITGFAAVALGDRNPDHEKARVLSKPFHLKELVDQVEDLLAA